MGTVKNGKKIEKKLFTNKYSTDYRRGETLVKWDTGAQDKN